MTNDDLRAARIRATRARVQLLPLPTHDPLPFHVRDSAAHALTAIDTLLGWIEREEKK